MKLLWPTKSRRVTSPWGARWGTWHNGIDIGRLEKDGEEIFAVADGTVARAWKSTSYGNTVILDHAPDLSSLYAHMTKFTVKPGDRVKAGQVIGYMGNTGDSQGVHLHFGVSQTKYNGAIYFSKDSKGVAHKNVDPMPYLKEEAK